VAGDPQEVARQIDRTREELGETVSALAARADVKARARAKARDAFARVKTGAAAAREKAAAQAASARERAATTTARARRRVRGKSALAPVIAMTVAAGVCLVAVERKRRRR
jgi:hypothetical protein